MSRLRNALLAGTFAGALGLWIAPAAMAQELSFSQVERGRYLATASDCVACHTNIEKDGKRYAGGRGLETPFGTIYSSNLTPDEATGLGGWSRDEFYRALNEGISRDGSHLYPAMPYPHFTKMSRDDADAIFAYLRTLEPVTAEIPENALPFPLSIRMSVAGWKLLFFDKVDFAVDPDRSEEWNRGRYLVDALAHCGACHTGKNLLGADKEDEYLRGGTLDNWYAPNIRGGVNGGLADWEAEDIVRFLGEGRSRHTAPMQRMGEVVGLSTQHLRDEDLMAIAVYLKSLDDEPREEAEAPAQARLETGEAIYFDNCAACHSADRSGVPDIFASLDSSNKLTAEDPATVIRIILAGARAQQTEAVPSQIAMPGFAWKLTDQQVADVVTYLRAVSDRKAGPVSAGEVEDMREHLQEK